MPYFLRTTIAYPVAPDTYNGEYAMLDVDGDGDLDIVCARFGPAAQFAGIPIQILLNNGSGGFTDGTSIIFPSGAPLTFHPRGIAIADYNGDGRPDLFIADHGYDELPWPGAQNTLLLSSGAHGFVDATDRLPQLIDYSHSTTAGDIDGDGDSDILVMNTNGGTPIDSTTDPYILLNDGTGHFVRHDDLLPANVAIRDSASKYTSCLFFDADGDGDQDLFIGVAGGESATYFSRLLYNDGTGDFSAAVSVDLPAGPWSPLTAGAVAVTTADLNGDGRPDLIVDLQNAYEGHYVQLLINYGDAGFVDETPDRMPQSTENDGRWIHSVKAVDLNGDGYVDLIARNGQYPPIFLNDGTGHFVNLPASFLDYGGWGTPWFVALNPIDANGDGRMDLIADFVNGEMFLFTQQDPGPSQTGTESADALLGDGSSETLSGAGGDDVIFGGAGADVISGGGGADTMVGGAGNDTMSGGVGDDIYVVADAGDVVIEDSAGGTDLVRSSISATLGANVENLMLTGATAINGLGNALANILSGNSGANSLSGLGGDDLLEGGAGNDTLSGGDGVDTASYASAGSAVAVSLALAGAQATGGAGSDTLGTIENLVGSAFNDTLTGNGGGNVIGGGAGNDTIDGGAGADTLIGGLGDDRFYIDNAGDTLTELAGQGDDIAFVLGTYTIAQGASVETLVALNQASTDALILTGNEFGQSLYGNLGDNYLNGGQGADHLVGLAGNDNLLGGTGADHMEGGVGNDVYYVDEAGDLITELAGEGDDTVVATASYALGSGVSIEVLSTEQSTAPINVTGNELAQTIYGNPGNNILTGMGGADYMLGGAGNDKYYVDTSDFIGEAVGGGDDWIFVASSYTLGAGNEIETLVAVNQDSTDPVNFTGNEFGQSLYGSQGTNQLDGGAGNDYLVGLGGNDFLIGGAGSDNLQGGTGNDLYYVDGGDQVFEAAGEGDDLAVALQSFVLGAGQSVETLTAAEGSANINLAGNELAQSLYGNAGNNILTSGGGADYMVGGAGNDIFVLTNAAGVATVGDYTAGDLVDIGQLLSVANGTNVVTGGFVRIVGTQLQIDANGGGDAFVTVGSVNGNGNVAVRYLAGGNATDASVARSAGQTEAIVAKTALDAGHGETSIDCLPVADFGHHFMGGHDAGLGSWTLHVDVPGIV